MKNFDRESLLKSSQKLKQVEINDGVLFIRKLSAREIFTMKEKTTSETPSEQTLFELVSISVVDKSGNPMLSVEDVSSLDMELINTLVIQVFEFNNLNPDAVKQAKEKLQAETLKGSTTN